MLVGSAKMGEDMGIGYGRARTLTSMTVAALMDTDPHHWSAFCTPQAFAFSC